MNKFRNQLIKKIKMHGFCFGSQASDKTHIYDLNLAEPP